MISPSLRSASILKAAASASTALFEALRAAAAKPATMARIRLTCSTVLAPAISRLASLKGWVMLLVIATAAGGSVVVSGGGSVWLLLPAAPDACAATSGCISTVMSSSSSVPGRKIGRPRVTAGPAFKFSGVKRR